MEQAEVVQRRLERITTQVYPESAHASRAVAERIAALIRERASAGKHAVLGLATGSTPVGVYEHLVRLHKEGLSFRNVVTFNLDEYWPMDPASIHSYSRFMREHLFDHIDIPRASIHIPDGTAARENVARACAAYEEAIRDAGGIDLQLLGIGRTGHVGFNEPGSSRESRTRLITLDRVTRMDAAGDFFGERHVPRQAITMGVGSIMDAREVVLMAFGEHKAGIVRRAVEEPVSAIVAASYLQQHASARFVLDAAAAAELTRIKTPWLLGSLADLGREWDTAITRKAVLWLATTVKKPILKLTNEDYNEHHLQDLLATRGGSKGAYEINLEVFRAMQRTITGWPAGKPRDGAAGFTDTPRDHRVPAAGPGTGGGSGDEFPKRVIVFSPHPDDDVISMGGTLIRLCEQGHEVHVAYQTSGNIAVWDEYALRHVDFVRELAALVPGLGKDAAAVLERDVSAFIAHKAAGEMDTATLQAIKGLIRRTEARAGARAAGVAPPRVHFLDLPFYETGAVRKKPLGERDYAITMELLKTVRPHQVYAAGDLSDPHGTHRVCLASVLESFRRLTAEPWMAACTLWLYRGAWQEWGPHEIEMAVPLSPDEVLRKRAAIFKHESQKDTALFPGPSDTREFWQRAEDRNRATARLYDALGLAEYEAIEGFVRWNGK
ncbi:MAG TPA: glucosamine-6-phosphate deaminase [Phycisphaerales bacterium]|nr:glucosamine-6-phosphate deaminase [Phycisphaerales bacterium]